jgi:hypothetical protein
MIEVLEANDSYSEDFFTKIVNSMSGRGFRVQVYQRYELLFERAKRDEDAALDSLNGAIATLIGHVELT